MLNYLSLLFHKEGDFFTCQYAYFDFLNIESGGRRLDYRYFLGLSDPVNLNQFTYERSEYKQTQLTKFNKGVYDKLQAYFKIYFPDANGPDNAHLKSISTGYKKIFEDMW